MYKVRVRSIPNKVCWKLGQSWRVECLDEEELGGRLRAGPVEDAGDSSWTGSRV